MSNFVKVVVWLDTWIGSTSSSIMPKTSKFVILV